MAKQNNRNAEQIKFNQQIKLDFYNRLKMLALSIYEWKNLPDTMDADFLEKSLYTFGKALIGFDKIGLTGLINTNVTPQGQLTMYDKYTMYRGYSNGFNALYKKDECVYVKNNPIEIPTYQTLKLFAERLTYLEIGILQNIRIQRFPVLVKMSESQKLSYENLIEKFEGGIPYIFGDDGFDASSVQVFDTKIPYVVDKLYDAKMEVWSEALTYLTINSANNEKKERMIVAEAEANNELLLASSNCFLYERQLACEQVNKIFTPYLEKDIECVKRSAQEIFMRTGIDVNGNNPVVANPENGGDE